MMDFLDKADELRKKHKKDPYAADVERVFDGINELKLVHSMATLDIYNIESVFAAFEIGELLGRVGSYEADDLCEFGRSMRRLITWTLENSIIFPRNQ